MYLTSARSTVARYRELLVVPPCPDAWPASSNFRTDGRPPLQSPLDDRWTHSTSKVRMLACQSQSTRA